MNFKKKYALNHSKRRNYRNISQMKHTKTIFDISINEKKILSKFMRDKYMNICFGWCWYGTNMHRGNHLYSMGIPCSICFIFPSSFIQVFFVQFFTYINDKVTWRDELHLLFSSLFMSIINMYFHDLFCFFFHFIRYHNMLLQWFSYLQINSFLFFHYYFILIDFVYIILSGIISTFYAIYFSDII